MSYVVPELCSGGNYEYLLATWVPIVEGVQSLVRKVQLLFSQKLIYFLVARVSISVLKRGLKMASSRAESR